MDLPEKKIFSFVRSRDDDDDDVRTEDASANDGALAGEREARE